MVFSNLEEPVTCRWPVVYEQQNREIELVFFVIDSGVNDVLNPYQITNKGIAGSQALGSNPRGFQR